MAYDFYAYHSDLGYPDVDEAISLVMDEAHATDASASPLGAGRQSAIVAALLEANPRLQPFELDHQVIAGIQNISVEEARRIFDYTELNTPEGDTALQITVFKNQVAITVPFAPNDNQAAAVFGQVDDYMMVIHRVSGYFVFDPQRGIAYDPSKSFAEGRDLPEQQAQSSADNWQSGSAEDEYPEYPEHKKPWWKFW